MSEKYKVIASGILCLIRGGQEDEEERERSKLTERFVTEVGGNDAVSAVPNPLDYT